MTDSEVNKLAFYPSFQKKVVGSFLLTLVVNFGQTLQTGLNFGRLGKIAT